MNLDGRDHNTRQVFNYVSSRFKQFKDLINCLHVFRVDRQRTVAPLVGELFILRQSEG